MKGQIEVRLIGTTLLLALSASAVPVTVQEMGAGLGEQPFNISSSGIGTADVFAGLINLQVNGVSVEGFCIDPYHWSVSGPQTDYSLVSLANAPKAPGGPMDQATANRIEQLWAQYYVSALSSSTVAAGLQLAIWQLVSGNVSWAPNTGNTGTFKLNGGPADAITAMNTDLTWLQNDTSAPKADLVGLTSGNGNLGQDYVIQNVPDGGTTLIMLGMSLFGLVFLQRKLRHC